MSVIGKFVVKVECLNVLVVLTFICWDILCKKIYSSGQIFYNLGHCSDPHYGKRFRHKSFTLIYFKDDRICFYFKNFVLKEEKKYTPAVKNRGVTLWYQSFGLDFHGVVSRVS